MSDDICEKTKNAERVTIELMKKHGINFYCGEQYSVRCQYAQVENIVYDLIESRESVEKENTELKDKIVKMRIRCNKIHSEQLQKIRKLKAVNMTQSQDKLI